MKKKYNNIGSSLFSVLEKFNLDHVYSLEQIKAKWSGLDKIIAIHSYPVAYTSDKKILKIKIDNKTWEDEFTQNKDVFLLKIKSGISDVPINKIEFL